MVQSPRIAYFRPWSSVFGGLNVTYRTKVMTVLVGFVVMINGLLGLAEYRRCKGLLEKEFHRKARSIASTAAALLDPELVRASSDRLGGETPAYRELRRQLQRIRDFNRRKDVWIADIFTLIRAPQDSHYVEYGVDAEESFPYIHRLGDLYVQRGQPVAIGIEGINRLADNLQSFQAGFNAAFAPVRDSRGDLIAVIGVRLSPAPYSVLNEVARATLGPFAGTVMLAVIVASILGRSVARPLETLRRQIDQVGAGNFNSIEVPAGMTGEFKQMAVAIAAMAKGLRERDTIKRAFSGYISRQVLETIMQKGELPELKGERRRITVLFADIRGFTTLAETMTPEDVVEMLSEFFDRMVEVLMRHQGTIDKFLGDGLMVIFGAPMDDPYQEQHAVLAALEMQKQLSNLCAQWQTSGRQPIKMGIGINSGAAVVGNIGSHDRMEYTAIGDTVNLAARLESATKELDLDIVVSEHTYSAVRPLFKWKPAGTIAVRGRSEPVRAYSVEGANGKIPG